MGPDRGSYDPDLAELFREHQSGLAGAVRGVLGPGAEVQEVLQEAFLLAWKSRAAGKRFEDPVAWVFVLTLNLARDLRRKGLRRGPVVEIGQVEDAMLQANEPGPAAVLEHREVLERAREAIFRLKDSDKQVFLLRVSGGLGFEAIGQALSIPTGTAKSRMRRALRELRASLVAFAPASTSRARLHGLEGDA